jgi:hypothetical protein
MHPLIIVIVVLVVLGILQAIIDFLSLYGHWVITIGTCLGLLGYWWWCDVKKKLRKEREERIESEARAEAQRQTAVTSEADAFLDRFVHYLTPCLVIDSNIWMKEEYVPFFVALKVVCQRANYTITMYGVQFDEIANIKKSTQYGEPRNIRARIAIDEIEKFQIAGLLCIKPVGLDAKPGAYADPVIIRVLAEEARKGMRCTFISDDKELRIRVREYLKNFAEADWTIINMSQLIDQCKLVQESMLYRSR